MLEAPLHSDSLKRDAHGRVKLGEIPEEDVIVEYGVGSDYETAIANLSSKLSGKLEPQEKIRLITYFQMEGRVMCQTQEGVWDGTSLEAPMEQNPMFSAERAMLCRTTKGKNISNKIISALKKKDLNENNQDTPNTREYLYGDNEKSFLAVIPYGHSIGAWGWGQTAMDAHYNAYQILPKGFSSKGLVYKDTPEYNVLELNGNYNGNWETDDAAQSLMHKMGDTLVETSKIIFDNYENLMKDFSDID